MLNDEKKVVEKQILARVFNIMQYEEYLNEEKIKQVLATYKTIKQFAYVKHDKDLLFSEIYLNDNRNVYSEEELNKKSKELKKPHFHIVLKFDVAINLHSVAKWFGIASNFIEIPKGRDSFIQCVQYLTHESAKERKFGKHHYDDSEIKSNFDFRVELDNYKNKQIKSQFKNATGKKLELREKVLKDGLKLSEIDSADYVNDISTLQLCRKEYLRNFARMPDTRINFYIQGGSGAGKSFSSRALAKSLIDPFDEKKEEEVFFVAGQGASMFQGYDGQPVIIFDDIRSWDLLNYYNKSASAIFNLFDIIPSKSEQNIKFGSIKLINTYFIVNGMQPFEEFVNDICYRAKESGFPEPDKQMYRRFLAKFNVKPHKYDFFVNQQYFNPEEKNYKLYKAYENMGVNCGIVEANKKWGETKKYVELRNKHFELPTKTAQEAIEYRTKKEQTEEELQQEFEFLMSENQVIEPTLFDASIFAMSDSEKIQKEIFELEQKIVELKNSKKKNPF